MDLTVLLDKMKGFESDPEEKISSLEEEIDNLHAIIDNLKDERTENEGIKQELIMLKEENEMLRKGRSKARESEDDEEDEDEDEEDEEEEEEEEVPQLIDVSQQKSMSEFRKLQTEDEFAEERLEFSLNDFNVTKNKAYIGWKNKAVSATKKMNRWRERGRNQWTRLVL